MTAHIDSTSNAAGYDPAPGADDNGTGSTAVLTIARILSQYDFDCSIRYALFTGEEQGLYGSSAYAQSLRTAEVNVEGVLNLDMLGYNTEGSLPTMELHTRPTKASDLAIAHAFTTTVSDYGLNLIPLVLRDGERASDHAPFWDRGYPAIMAIEDWNDHTPKYHRTTDTVPSLNLPYTTQFVKAALGTMARLGCLLDGQAQGVVRSAGQPLPGAVVEAWQDGQIVRSAVTAADGSYRLPLLPGDYDLAFRAAGHQGVMTPAVQVVQKQAVVTDQDLSACQTATDLSFSVDPPRPQPGQNVHFSAFANGAQPLSYTWRFGDGVEAAGATVDHTFAALGAYTITLSADNVCIYPISTQGNLTVSHYVLYMPLMGK